MGRGSAESNVLYAPSRPRESQEAPMPVSVPRSAIQFDFDEARVLYMVNELDEKFPFKQGSPPAGFEFNQWLLDGLEKRGITSLASSRNDSDIQVNLDVILKILDKKRLICDQESVDGKYYRTVGAGRAVLNLFDPEQIFTEPQGLEA